jgi:hypothetical protein
MPPVDAEARRLVGRQAGNQPCSCSTPTTLATVRERLAAHDVEVWAEREDATSRSLHFRDIAGLPSRGTQGRRDS